MKGVVKFYNKKKGFGFIEASDAEYFFHKSFIVDDKKLNEGEKVTFDVEVTPNGKFAKNVRKGEHDEN